MDSNLLGQIQKTDPRTLFIGAITFLALIGPVMIEINVSNPASYRALSVSKLILLAIGATLPVGILNTLLCYAATKHDKASQILPGTPDLNVSAGLAITALILYANVGLQFLIGYSLRTFIIVCMIFELLVIVWSIAQIIDANKQKQI
jgi:hypothetical protein